MENWCISWPIKWTICDVVHSWSPIDKKRAWFSLGFGQYAGTSSFSILWKLLAIVNNGTRHGSKSTCWGCFPVLTKFITNNRPGILEKLTPLNILVGTLGGDKREHAIFQLTSTRSTQLSCNAFIQNRSNQKNLLVHLMKSAPPPLAYNWEE